MSTCPIPKLERDWIGRRVRALQDIESNGGSICKKGRIAFVTDSYGGLKIRATRKPHFCISRVQKWKVKLLPK